MFGGHQCANIPSGKVACDHIVEELPPTTAWGQNFVSMPLATRTAGDTFRILASQDATTVQLNGSTVATLNRGEFHEQIVTGPAQITANKPVLVMQYSNSSSFDGVTSDPFQMMIPPFEQFLASYTVSTPASGFRPTSSTSSRRTRLSGRSSSTARRSLPARSRPSAAPGSRARRSPWRSARTTSSGPLPFGVHSYGFASFDSYGYPGGLSLSEVASVTTLSLAPETATNPVGRSTA